MGGTRPPDIPSNQNYFMSPVLSVTGYSYSVFTESPELYSRTSTGAKVSSRPRFCRRKIHQGFQIVKSRCDTVLEWILVHFSIHSTQTQKSQFKIMRGGTPNHNNSHQRVRKNCINCKLIKLCYALPTKEPTFQNCW